MSEALPAILSLVGRSHRRLLGLDELAVEVLTQKPVALDSPDHLMPWGTRQDNSTNLQFNLKLARWLPLETLSVLDLGCSGGGFVKSVLDMGCLAVGLEGSDYSQVRARTEWATIPSICSRRTPRSRFASWAAAAGSLRSRCDSRW